jgi:S1-C subfamily serine protease
MTPAEIASLRIELNGKFATLSERARGQWAAAAAGADYLLANLDPVGARESIARLPIPLAIAQASVRANRAEFLAIIDAALNSPNFPTPPITATP